MSRPRLPVPPVVAAGLLALVLAGCGGAPDPPEATPPDAAPSVPVTTAPSPPAGIGSAESAEVGAPASTNPATSPPAPAAPDPLVSGPPSGATALPASRVEAVRLAPGTPGVVWTRGERVVGLYGRAGGCTDVSAEFSGEDATAVRITVLTVRSAEQACTLEVRYPPLEVTLPTDLGPRRVVLTGADG